MSSNDETFIERLRAVREDAIEILRQAGFVFSFQADSPIVSIVCDSISLSYNEDKTVFRVDGSDLANIIHSITMTIRPGQYPVFNVNFVPKAIKTVNTPDHELGIKLPNRRNQQPTPGVVYRMKEPVG